MSFALLRWWCLAAHLSCWLPVETPLQEADPPEQESCHKGYEGLRERACCGEGESCLSGTSAVQLAYCLGNKSGTLAVFRWPESVLLTCSAPAHSSVSEEEACMRLEVGVQVQEDVK